MIRSLSPADQAVAEALITEVLGSRHQARLDEVVDVFAHPGFGAWEDDRLVGVATYAVAHQGAELTALGVAADKRGAGHGGRLVEAVADAVRARRVRRLWLVTTNDNLEALALYQRHGFRLVELRAGAIDRARSLKPEIPQHGRHGIPMRDELVLERDLT